MLLRPVLRPVLRPALRSPFVRSATAFAVAALFAAGEPGVHYETYNPDSLLMRRNALTYSEQFDNAVWTKTSVTVTQNAIAAPDGSLTADFIVTGNVNAQQRIYWSGAGAPVKPGTATISVYAKAGTFRYLRLESGYASGYANFDLIAGVAGSVGPNSTSAITDAGNGWYRVSWTATDNTAGATSDYRIYIADSANSARGATTQGDGVGGFYLWGAQAESGALSAYQKVTDWNTEYLAAAGSKVTMWQDYGSPVTMVEQTVGQWFDLSRGLALGAQLCTDPGMDTPAAWAASVGWAVTGGKGVATAAGVGTFLWQFLGTIVANKVYEIAADVVVTAGSVAFFAGGAGTATSPTITQSGTYTYRVAAWGGTGGQIGFVAKSTFTGTIDNVSFREVTGSHAFQATGSSRPKLSARYNLLVKTEQLADGSWTKLGVTPTYGFAAPDGTATAWKLTEDTSSNQHFCYCTLGVVHSSNGEVHRNKVWAKTNGRDVRLSWVVGASSSGAYVDVNLTTGAVVNSGGEAGGGAVIAATAVPAGNGWWEITLDSTIGTTGQTFFVMQCRASLANVTGEPGYIGDGASGVFVWHPDHRIASDGNLAQPSYQRVNTATDYDTAGFIHYLKFDGIDDSLQTPAIDMSACSKMTVWAGVTKLSDSAASIIAELNTTSAADGSFYVAGPGSAATNFGFSTRGTTANTARLTDNYAAPVTAVVNGALDNSAATAATQVQPRVNGAVPASVTTQTGPTFAGNYANAALNIGRRNNASLPFNGRLTSLTVRGTTTPTSVAFIKSMEQYAAKLAGQTFTST